MYHILLKMFIDMDTYVHVKQKKYLGWSSCVFLVHEQFLDPDHMARQAVETKRKLWASHYDGKKKSWD